MNLKQWIKIVLLAITVVALGSCAKHKKYDPNAVNNANAAYSGDAQASGLGDESSFGGEAGSEQMLSKRVYYFDFDSYTVHDQDRSAIRANADYLTAHPRTKVLLEGHTDPRGSREYNIGLGERRAKAVADVLTNNGVNPNQIRIVSYGAEKLASPGRSEHAYQLDRRVVLVYMQQ